MKSVFRLNFVVWFSCAAAPSWPCWLSCVRLLPHLRRNNHELEGPSGSQSRIGPVRTGKIPILKAKVGALGPARILVFRQRLESVSRAAFPSADLASCSRSSGLLFSNEAFHGFRVACRKWTQAFSAERR